MLDVPHRTELDVLFLHRRSGIYHTSSRHPAKWHQRCCVFKRAVLELRAWNEFLPCARAPSRNGTKVLKATQADWTSVHEGLVCSGTISVRGGSYPLERSRNQSERLNLPHVTTVPRTPVRMLLSCLWLVLNLLFMLLPFKMSCSFLIKRLTFCKREALIPSLSLKVEIDCSLSSPLDSVMFNNTACNSSKTFFFPWGIHLSLSTYLNLVVLTPLKSSNLTEICISVRGYGGTRGKKKSLQPHWMYFKK